MRDIDQLPHDRVPTGGFGHPTNRPPAQQSEAERAKAKRDELNQAFKHTTPQEERRPK